MLEGMIYREKARKTQKTLGRGQMGEFDMTATETGRLTENWEELRKLSRVLSQFKAQWKKEIPQVFLIIINVHF